MAGSISTEADKKQIEARGMSIEEVIAQTEIFRKGFPYARLLRPCTLGDGITLLQEGDVKRLGNYYSEATLSGRAMKFVPASGAASRMFKILLTFNNLYEKLDEKDIIAEAEKDDPDHRAFIQFMKGIKRFAFYDDLKAVMEQDGLDIEDHITKGHYKIILDYIVSSRGLNLTNLPKGLIKFHLYPDYGRTPFEEHMVEAAAYTRDGEGIVRMHFTVSTKHEGAIRDYIEEIRSRYERSEVQYEVTFSSQKPSTDTIAVDTENRPFRERDGGLLFRPGGHGALLKNLNDLEGDIIFIKNIDNVVPDRLKHETYIYKRALGGYLIELQNEIFGYLRRLSRKDVDEKFIRRVLDFARQKLSIMPPDDLMQGSGDEKIGFLFSRLNRPLRVCGMVKNVAEPGGGPFWVEHEDNTVSLQIVESSQVDMESIEQKAIWESSTHFNPVDLVCGVGDYLGKPFNLMDYRDPNTGFISIKSKEGRELKALELPGLWNGSMAHWNSVFVEVPTITFNPVKTVVDLLRDEHQPEQIPIIQ
jgi:hypothetical protein